MARTYLRRGDHGVKVWDLQNELKVLGISCITNMATGLSEKKLYHKEISVIAQQVMNKFQRLIGETIVQIYKKFEIHI